MSALLALIALVVGTVLAAAFKFAMIFLDALAKGAASNVLDRRR